MLRLIIKGEVVFALRGQDEGKPAPTEESLSRELNQLVAQLVELPTD